MNRKLPAALFVILLVFAGCLGTPGPLNDTGILPHPAGETPGLTPEQLNSEALQSGSVKCSVADVEGMDNVTIFMKGSDIRSEYFDPQANWTYVTIVRGGQYYIMGGQNNTPFENCSWISFNRSTFAGSGYDQNTPFGVRAPNYTSIPGMPKCRPDVFGAEIFQVNGTVCDFGAVMGAALANTLNCSVIGDPGERALCESGYNKTK